MRVASSISNSIDKTDDGRTEVLPVMLSRGDRGTAQQDTSPSDERSFKVHRSLPMITNSQHGYASVLARKAEYSGYTEAASDALLISEKEIYSRGLTKEEAGQTIDFLLDKLGPGNEARKYWLV